MWGSSTCSLTSSTWDWTYFISSNTSPKSLPPWRTQNTGNKNQKSSTKSRSRFGCSSHTILMCWKNGTTKNVVQTSCIVKKYKRSCSDSTTKLRSCNDMRAATQLKNSWTATGATCSLLGMRGNHRSSKVSRSDAQWGSHLKEDGHDKFSSSYFFLFNIKEYEELKGHINKKYVH